MICPVSFGVEWKGSVENSITARIGIIPCCLCEDCYVKADHFWCNHCVDLYDLIMPIINEDKNVILAKVMKATRGKIIGEQVSRIIDKLKEIDGEINAKSKA